MPEPEANYGQDQDNYVSIFDKQEEKDSLATLVSEIQSEETYQAEHISHVERFFRKRFGIRPAVVTWPWRNASNLHLPLTDRTIRRSKPNFTNLVTGVYPTVQLRSNVLGESQNLIRAVERHFHDTLHDSDKMAIDLKAIWGVDLMLERGRFITKVIQEFTPTVKYEEVIVANLPENVRAFIEDPGTTDDALVQLLAQQYDMDLENDDDVVELKAAVKQFRDGKTTVKFQREVNLTPFPSLHVRDPITVLFPQDTTFFVGQARWIRDRVALTVEDLEIRAEKSTWNKANTNELIRRIRDGARTSGIRIPSTETERIKDLEKQREGVSAALVGSPFVDEIYLWKKMPGERMPQRMVLTVHPEHLDLPLRLIRYPYVLPDGTPEEWPFDQVMFEIVSDRALAPRGYPQMLDSLQTELTNNHNAKQNWMTIANSLNLKAKRNANVSTQWIPGQPLWLNRMDDAQEMNIAQRDMSFDNEERILKGWAEEYIGLALDQTLSNQTAMPERRTKAEIEAATSVQQVVASLDVQVFQLCMQRVYTKIWNRYMQYGPTKIKMLNSNGDPIEIPKVEIQNRFRPVPTGDLTNSNKSLRSSRLWQIFQATNGNPYVNGYKLLRNAMAAEDERLADDVIEKPEDVRMMQAERFISDIRMINDGYIVIPRPDDDNQLAIAVITDYLQDPVKRRNFHADRLETLQNFQAAHNLAGEKKRQASTRGGRTQQEVAEVAQGMRGREARQ